MGLSTGRSSAERTLRARVDNRREPAWERERAELMLKKRLFRDVEAGEIPKAISEYTGMQAVVWENFKKEGRPIETIIFFMSFGLGLAENRC